MKALLRVTRLQTGYGRNQVLKGIDLEVFPGEIVALLGANGSGKTTALSAISGVIPAWGGNIEFEGQSLQGMHPSQVVRKGLVHCPEGRQLFPELTVRENLTLGAYARRATARELRADLEVVYGLFPILAERSGQLAGTMSGGQQQMLAIGRALMARPKLLMMDEPSLGLAPLVVQQLFGLIRRINSSGTPILLVEQNARASLRIASRAYVLESGRMAIAGSAEQVLADPRIKEVYLGAS